MTKEEAINKIRQTSLPKETMEILQALAPELRESEDERIRKWIIEKVQGYADSGIPFPGEIQIANKAIAWLEKRKDYERVTSTLDRIIQYVSTHNEDTREVKHNNPKKLYYNGVDDTIAEICSIINEESHSQQDVINNPEDYGLQKEQPWVPTDEQRSALGMVIKYSDPDADSTKVLESLLDELTKIVNPKVAKWKEKQKEQKPVDIAPNQFDGITYGMQGYSTEKPVEWSDEFEETLNTFLFNFAHSPSEDCEPKEYIKKHADRILKAAYKELRARLEQDFFEAKQEGIRDGIASVKPAEWSEEDEHYLNSVINLVHATTVGGSYIGDRIVNWLKNLPGRFNLEPKEEWSEEDEKKIHFLSRLIEFQVKDDEYCFGDGRLISKQEAIEMLESLCPQPKQEWNEEDERLINTSISFLKDFADKGYENAVECIAWLKSLRPQPKRDCKDCAMFLNGGCTKPRWKPSEEQMKALLNAEGYLREGDQFDSAKSIAQLYEHLKKL